MLYLHLMEGKGYPEIANEMNMPINKIYKLAEKMKEKIRKQAEKKIITK